jgi:hypothetical protein
MNPETRQWGGFSFSRVAALDPKRGPDGAPLEFMPQDRYAKASTSILNAYGVGPFCKFSIPWALKDAGVYVITLDDRPVYVGECVRLGQRFNMGYGTIQPKNCYVGGQPTNCKVNAKVLAEARAGRVPILWFMQTDDRHRVESSLISALHPAWNGRQS